MESAPARLTCVSKLRVCVAARASSTAFGESDWIWTAGVQFVGVDVQDSAGCGEGQGYKLHRIKGPAKQSELQILQRCKKIVPQPRKPRASHLKS